MARKFLTPIDLTVNELRNAVIQNLASAPSSPIAGLCYFDTVLGQFGIYSGSTWLYLTPSGGTTAGGDLTGTYPNPTLVGTSNVETIIRANRLDQFAAPTASVNFGSQNITGLLDPTTAQMAATKNYVDSVAQGLSAKPSVVALATTNLTLSGTQTIDGIAVVATNRVLATGQTTSSQNGLWVVAAGSWSRPTDFASATSQLGTYVFVEGGTANGSSGWVLTATAAVTVDTTAQSWTQFSGAGEISVTTPIQKTGNTLSLATVPVASGGTGGTTASAARTNLSSTANALPQKYSVLVGTGSSTSIAVTHGLGTQDVVVAVYDASAFNVVECDVVYTSTSVVTLGFTVAPASNAYKCVVIG